MSDRTRNLLRKILIPASQFAVAGLGGLSTIHFVSPSQEVRAGPLVIDQSVDVGRTSTFLGEELFVAPPLSVDVDIKLIDRKDYPKAIDEVSQIYLTESGKEKEPHEIRAQIEKMYGADFDDGLRRLGLETVAWFAIGGSTSVYALRRASFFPKGEKKRPANGHHIDFTKAVACALVATTLGTSTTYVQVDQDKIPTTVEEIVSAPIENYLLTGTSKMVVDFDSMSSEVSKHLGRAVGFQRAVTNTQRTMDIPAKGTQVVLIVSDPHSLPTAPGLIEQLARSAEANFIIILGDFENTGAQFEEDALFGFTLGDTTFQGYDDIRTCIETIYDKCTREGSQFDIYALTGNHDTKSLLPLFKKLGFKDLVTEPPAIFKDSMVAMHDACHVDELTCFDSQATVNKNAAEKLRDELGLFEDGADIPSIGFFADKSAAEVFDDVPILISGGTHLFSGEEKNGRQRLKIGTVGEAFPRGAEYSNAVVATFAPVKEANGSDVMARGHVVMDSCTSVKWTLYNESSNGVTLAPCFD